MGIEQKPRKRLSNKKLLFFFVLGIVANFGLLYFLFDIDAKQNDSLNPYKQETINLEADKKVLDEQIVSLQSNLYCEEEPIVEEEVKGVLIGIKYYDEYQKPIKVADICTSCEIRKVGYVESASPQYPNTDDVTFFEGFQILTVISNSEFGEKVVTNFVTNIDYSKIYIIVNDLNWGWASYDQEFWNPDTKKYISYIAQDYMITSDSSDVLPSGMIFGKNFETEKGRHFYASYTTPNELQDMNLTEIDTFQGTKIYEDSNKPGFFYFQAKDFLMMEATYIPSLAVYSHNGSGQLLPYPILWSDGEKNEYVYNYGYDVCSQWSGLRIANVTKDELKVTGKWTETDQNIYEYKDTENSKLKKMYEQDYLTYQFPYSEEQQAGKSPLTYEQFLAQHPIIFWQEPADGRFVEFYNTKFVMEGGCAKPIVYLYPEKQTDISVKVVPTTGSLTFTYPEYDGVWNITADRSGNLTDTEGKKYEYLWWESTSEYLPQKDTGFIVKPDNLDAFFDLTLSMAGFNQKEINDFKEFWIPTMNEQYSQFFKIYFLQNEEVDSIANLLINPLPITEIRLFMVYERLDSYTKIEPQEIINTPRKGFTVTEWGGTRR